MNRIEAFPQLEFEKNGQTFTITLPAAEAWFTQNGRYCFSEAVSLPSRIPVWVKECKATPYRSKLIAAITTNELEYIPQPLTWGARAERFYYATLKVDGDQCHDGLQNKKFFMDVLESPTIIVELIKAWAIVLRGLNELGHFYRDVTLKNTLINVSQAKVWIIDLDSCCEIGSDIMSGESFCQDLSILLPRAAFSKWKTEFRTGTPLASQISAIGMAFSLVRAHNLVKVGNAKVAKTLLSKTLSINSNLERLANCLSRSSPEDTLHFVGVRGDSLTFAQELGEWRSKAAINVQGDWDLCFNLLEALNEAAFGLTAFSKERIAVQKWIAIYERHGGNLDPFAMLEKWPKNVDPSQFRSLRVQGRSVPELIESLQIARQSAQLLESLVDKWKDEIGVEEKAVDAQRICGTEGAILLDRLHEAHPDTPRLRERCSAILQWFIAIEDVKTGMSKAEQLAEFDEIEQAVHLVETHLVTWGKYRPLVVLYQRLRNIRTPWDSAELRASIDVARTEKRYFQVATRLSLLLPSHSKDELARETAAAVAKANDWVAIGKREIKSKQYSEAIMAFSSALKYAADCHEAKVGLALASTAERSQRLQPHKNVLEANTRNWFWRQSK